MNRFLCAAALLAAIAVAGCVNPGAPPTSSSATTPSSTHAFPTTATLPTFPPGTYYSRPNADGPNTLVHLESPLSREVRLMGNGYYISSSRLVAVAQPTGPDDPMSRFQVQTPDGGSRVVTFPGLYYVARPSLSDDATRTALQGIEDLNDRPAPGKAAGFAIYVANLSDGDHHRVSPDGQKCESPAWIPGTDRVALGCFVGDQPGEYVVDATTGKIILKLPGNPDLQIAVSKDGRHLLKAGLLQVLNLTDGRVEADLRDEALAGLSDAGYEVDTAHAGFNRDDAFPLDGDFSPDGNSLVFDGPVKKGNQEGLLVMSIRLDGSGFKVLAGPVPVDPARANNNNYSQINPRWI